MLSLTSTASLLITKFVIIVDMSGPVSGLNIGGIHGDSCSQDTHRYPFQVVESNGPSSSSTAGDADRDSRGSGQYNVKIINQAFRLHLHYYIQLVERFSPFVTVLAIATL